MKAGGGDDPFADDDGGTDVDAPAETERRSPEPTGWGDEATLQDEMLEQLRAIDAGDRADQLSVRNARYTALLVALEERGELADVAESLADELGVDVGDVNRSRVVELAIGLGLKTAEPEIVETVQEAQAERARRDL